MKKRLLLFLSFPLCICGCNNQRNQADLQQNDEIQAVATIHIEPNNLEMNYNSFSTVAKIQNGYVASSLTKVILKMKTTIVYSKYLGFEEITKTIIDSSEIIISTGQSLGFGYHTTPWEYAITENDVPHIYKSNSWGIYSLTTIGQMKLS